MVSKSFILAVAAVAGLTEAAGTGTSGNGASNTLDTSVISTGSFFDGSDGLGAESTQALSAVSTNNFIDFCKGQTITNGLQIVTGSCNPIPMGKIPAKTQMISSIITFPQNGQTIKAGQQFNITVQTQNLVAGAFTNADATYYAAPQDLQNGQVIGHTHVTVQDLGKSLNPTTPPDATQFAFFKGINDAGNNKGLLQATVVGGLPAGNYRVCTLTSSSNHQPVLMPVAQRGSSDDCSKFVVSGNGGTTNNAANNGAGGIAAAAAAASAVVDGPGALTSTAKAAAATNAKAGTGKGAAATTAKAAATTAAAAGNGKGAAAGTAKAAATNAAAGNGKGAAAAGTAKAATAKAATAKAATATAAAANKGGNAAAANAGGKAQAQGGQKGQRRSPQFSRRVFVA